MEQTQPGGGISDTVLRPPRLEIPTLASRRRRSSVRRAALLLSGLVMLAVTALIGCASYDYKYAIRQGLPGDVLANPRVGLAVLVDVRDPAPGDEEGVPSGFASAAEDALRSRGYEPTVLESRVIREDIHDLAWTVSPNKYRKLRPMLQEPVFTKAAAQGMAGVFVVWVSATRVSPSDLAVRDSSLGTTLSYTGSGPVLMGMCMIEVFSSQGEPLKVFGAQFRGFTITPTDATVTSEGGTPVTRVGTYLVLTPEETAAKSIKEAFTTLGGLPPYSGPK